MISKNKVLIIFSIILLVSITFTSKSSASDVSQSDHIIFKDKNLEEALRRNFKWDADFTIQKAEELSKSYNSLKLENANITDLDGIQYFVHIRYLYLSGNTINNLKPLSSLRSLIYLNLSNNAIKGKELEKILIDMGRIQTLKILYLNNNSLSNINFLETTVNVKNIIELFLNNNKIKDISLLKKCTNLEYLSLVNNRIQDVSPIKNLKKLNWYLDLRDNCIIDYKPVKPIMNKIFEEIDSDIGLERSDYYKNPVNFKFNGKNMKFTHLTVYYQYESYAEATQFFKTIGGSAIYNKKTGTLTCKYKGNKLIVKDFSRSYTLNGKKMSLKYPMRRMQYDLAYIPVKDISEALGFKYKVVKKESYYKVLENWDDELDVVYAPTLVEIESK